MNHIDEEILELYALGSEIPEDRRREIGHHLKECAGCLASYNEMLEYYKEVAAIQAERAEAALQALTVRSILVQTPPVLEHGPPGRWRMTLPAKLVFLVIKHPVVSSFGVAALLVASLLMGTTIKMPKDMNPAFARAKDEFLVVYNREGGELWRKHVGVDYDLARLQKHDFNYRPEQYLQTVDMDGDGRNEVIAIFGIREGWPARNTVYCYNADQSIRWSYQIHEPVGFGAERLTDSCYTKGLLTGDFDRDGKQEVIVIATRDPYYPTLVLRLNGSTGAPEGSYWHSGFLHSPKPRDIDSDGVEELFFLGENNGYGRGVMVVLDPRYITGHGPAPSSHMPTGVSPGNEKYYIMFPLTDLDSLGGNRPVPNSVTFDGDTSMYVNILNHVSTSDYGLLYHLNNSMTCGRVVGNDLFTNLHHTLRVAGKLTRTLDDQYWEQLRQGVSYWDGNIFMNESTPNKKFRRTSSLP